MSPAGYVLLFLPLSWYVEEFQFIVASTVGFRCVASFVLYNGLCFRSATAFVVFCSKFNRSGLATASARALENF